MPTNALSGYRLSPQQSHLWRFYRSNESFPYRVLGAILIDGVLDLERLQAALQRVTEQHEILRTQLHRLAGQAAPVQVIADSVPPEVASAPQTTFGAADVAAALFESMQQESYDLEHGPILSVMLVALAPDQHVLCLGLTALNADGDTIQLLTRELAAAYAAGPDPDRANGLSELPLQYADIVAWQHQLLESEEGSTERSFWQDRIGSARPALRLPWALEAAAGASFTPEQIRAALAPEQSTLLRSIARDQASSPASVLLACWQVLLWRLSGQAQLTIGVSCNGRTYAELAESLGPLTKYLPLSAQLRPDEHFAALLTRTEQALQDAEEHQEYFSPEQLPEDLPFFPIAFDFATWNARFTAGATTFTLATVAACLDRFELKLACTDQHDRIQLELQYDATRYDRDDMHRLLAEFQTLVAQVLADPTVAIAAAEIVSPAEREQLLVGFNQATTVVRRDLCLHQIFEEQARSRPDSVALIFRDQQLTFGELNARANRLAHYLRRQGVGPEVIVGIYVERSLEMIVGLLAVLKAGGAYVPLEPAYPKERIAYILAESRAPIVLTQQPLQAALADQPIPQICLDADSALFADEPTSNPDSGVLPHNLAYIIYTSGSTGQPKGVALPHTSAVHYAAGLFQAVYGGQVSPDLRVSLNAPFVFDASIKQLVHLFHGCSLVVIPPEIRLDVQGLAGYLEQESVDVFDCTPSQLRLLLTHGLLDKQRPRYVLIGGEAIDDRLWQQLRAVSDKQFYNMYGPTECTVNTTICQIQSIGARPTLGRPIANVQIYLLDESLRPVPLGVPGEIYIGGAGVARGYLESPQLTAARFLPHPFSQDVPGARLYKTGDLGRYRSDGTIEYLGRSDHQVKVRGFRIELGEIEAALQRHPKVREAAVLLHGDGTGDKRLVGYVAPHQRYAPAIAGRERYVLPNNLAVAHLNKHETDLLYQEVFGTDKYIRNGLTIRDGDCILDVGANIGLFTLFASRHCPNGRIYAFEPNPYVFELLRLNTSLYNVNATLFKVGLAQERKTAPFTFYPSISFLSGLYADTAEDIEIVRAAVRSEHEGNADKFEELIQARFEQQIVPVQLIPLSDVIREQQIERVDLLKMNVEKSELDVLLGIRDEDWSKIRQIVLELHDIDGRLAYVVQLLERHGFQTTVEQHWSLTSTKDGYYVYGRRDVAGEQAANGTTQPQVEAAPIEPPLTTAELRAYLKASLPEFMIPATLLLLESLPLNTSGKIDRQALASTQAIHESGQDGAPPETEIEQAIAQVWKRHLQIDRIGVQSNFFDLGGHSLLMIQVHDELQQRLGQAISLLDLFTYPTISSLAAYLTSQPAPTPKVTVTKEQRETQSSQRSQRRQLRQRSRGQTIEEPCDE